MDVLSGSITYRNVRSCNEAEKNNNKKDERKRVEIV